VTRSSRDSVGKDELIEAALDFVTAHMREVLTPNEGAPAEVITDLFLQAWRSLLMRSKFRVGGPVVAVTAAADSYEVLEQVGETLRTWRRRLARLLVKGGLARPDAESFAAFLVAASEGAAILVRAEQTIEPFDLVAAQLLEQVRSLASKS
jgi:TetR/AcrR family transcriptional repressor of lmrAB and yxaGH operons